MPISNSIDFLDIAVNGDIPELDVVQPARPKSDFYVNPPRLKVDEYIKKGIDEACNLVINSKPDDFETGTDIAVLAGSVKTLTEERRQITADKDTLVNQLESKRREHAEATKSGDKPRIKDAANELIIIEAALKQADELLKAKDAEVKEAEAAFNTAMSGGSGVQPFTKVFLKSKAGGAVKMLGPVPGFAIVPSSYPMKQELLEAGISGEIGKASAKLRRSSLDNNVRLLLSNEPLYIYCLFMAYSKDNVKDADGLLNRVMVYIDDVQQGIQAYTAGLFFKAKKLDTTQIDKDTFIEQIKTAVFSYASGKPVAYMNSVIGQQMKYGNLPKYVDDFFASGEIPAEKGTPEIKKRMVEYLYNLDL
ncbi:MAG TPA: hypothetical protein VEB42_05130, partial [Chitinophagaceae bacterium]|nr:hypothetical protein [Chitinophagaceae bacterium]